MTLSRVQVHTINLMALRHLIFVLLFYLCSGTFLTFGFVHKAQVGHRYFLYHGIGLALLALLSFFVLEPGDATLGMKVGIFGFVFLSGFYSLIATENNARLANIFYILTLAAASTVIYLDIHATLERTGLPVSAGVLLVNALLSAAFLGFTMAAMLLGHWYLVEPKLSIDELIRLSLGFIVISIVRFVFGTYFVSQSLWGMSELEIYRFLFSSTSGIFVLMRWAWGLLSPLLLGYLVWNTVRIRSTQSATGILYVAVLCVLTGETLSQYLALFHQLPF